MGPSLAIEVHGSEANRSQSHPIGRPLSTEELHDDVEVAIEGKVCHDEDEDVGGGVVQHKLRVRP